MTTRRSRRGRRSSGVPDHRGDPDRFPPGERVRRPGADPRLATREPDEQDIHHPPGVDPGRGVDHDGPRAGGTASRSSMSSWPTSRTVTSAGRSGASPASAASEALSSPRAESHRPAPRRGRERGSRGRRADFQDGGPRRTGDQRRHGTIPTGGHLDGPRVRPQPVVTANVRRWRGTRAPCRRRRPSRPVVKPR